MFIVNVSISTKFSDKVYPVANEDVKIFSTLEDAKTYVNGYLSTILKGEFSTDLNIHSISGGDDGIYKVSCDYWNCDKSFKIYDNTKICIREIDEKNGCLKFLV